MEVLASAVKSDYDFVNRMNILRELIIEAREIVEIKWLTEKDLCLEDIVTICTLASMKMKSNDDSISINELLQSLYYSPETILKQRNAFLSGAHKLLQGKLIERHVDDFLVEHSIKLTDFALNNLIGEILTDTTDNKVMAIHS